MDQISILSSRAMSAFPLSIGTSLAFESIFDGTQTPYDPTRKIPEKINIDKYNILLINIATLVRNIVGSIPTKDAEQITPKALVVTLEEEIRCIFDIFKMYDPVGKTSLYFYSRNYSLIEKTFSRSSIVRFYKPNTEKQLLLYNQIHSTISILRKKIDFDFVHYDLGVSLYPKSLSTALIFTHIPYDLLVYDNFQTLNLLESHTGLLKTKKDFWTKYYDSKKLDLSNIPFQRKLLAIFGDHVMFKPTHIKIREDIIDLSKKCNWTAISSISKINMDFNTRLADLGIKVEYNRM